MSSDASTARERAIVGATPAWVRAIDRLVEVIGEATSWLALVIVVLMATNVLLRYLFSIGSVWSQELEWHLLAPLILFGMSYALLHGEHVRVDVLYADFSARNKAVVDFVSALLSIAICVDHHLAVAEVRAAVLRDRRDNPPTPADSRTAGC